MITSAPAGGLQPTEQTLWGYCMTTVFLSSTPFDLAAHRKEIGDTLSAAGLHPALTFPDTPVSERLRLVRTSKVCIVIFGMMLGNVDPDTGKSLVQLEYEEAQLYSVPTLVFLMDEDEHWILPKHADTGPAGLRLADLKAQISLQHEIRFFESRADLTSKIANELSRLLGVNIPLPDSVLNAPSAYAGMQQSLSSAPPVAPAVTAPATVAASAPVTPAPVAAPAPAPVAAPAPAAPPAAVVTPVAATPPVPPVPPAVPAQPVAEPVSASVSAPTPAPAVADSKPVAEPEKPAARGKVQRYDLTGPRYMFFREKVQPALTIPVHDVLLKEVLEYLLVSNTMPAASAMAKGANLELEDAIEIVRQIELILMDTIRSQKNAPKKS
ncbi:DUF4062 domain-containing protein [Undibacterium luofuense]|uniref:DUF4062 domain-containing protein n=1 Tax=Undibacterium luofuense TaxID=2828733 RepID=A0A941DGX1_9BURK|nr:DUF4062 domain-containing protein [Undibacterium luofuense]MBR7780692.1 DUF4062 domain-containing protein [Undibacterium luofuense]